jgi:hypothetical protein
MTTRPWSNLTVQNCSASLGNIVTWGPTFRLAKETKYSERVSYLLLWEHFLEPGVYTIADDHLAQGSSLERRRAAQKLP